VEEREGEAEKDEMRDSLFPTYNLISSEEEECDGWWWLGEEL